jgi:hypothetical protein
VGRREPEWSIPEHLEALSRRAPEDHQRVATVLASQCWPGGAADRVHRSALDWVRRWGPNRVTGLMPVCGCADGRCGVCN